MKQNKTKDMVRKVILSHTIVASYRNLILIFVVSCIRQ